LKLKRKKTNSRDVKNSSKKSLKGKSLRKYRSEFANSAKRAFQRKSSKGHLSQRNGRTRLGSRSVGSWGQGL
jgi:hypothetical protein